MMEQERDIRFTEKKVDESWKEQIAKENSKEAASTSSSTKTSQKTSESFMGLLNSLALQAMLHLGEIPNPQTGQAETNIDAAKEMIDLLVGLKEKTAGNLSDQENEFFVTALSELQTKFVQKS